MHLGKLVLPFLIRKDEASQKDGSTSTCTAYFIALMLLLSGLTTPAWICATFNESLRPVEIVLFLLDASWELLPIRQPS